MSRYAVKKNFEPIHDRSSEKEIIKIWSDIKENNVVSINSNLNKNLMKAISEKEPIITDVKIGEDGKDNILFSKQMWDSEKGSWVPFDLWGAHFIVNQRKEYVALRMFRPCAYQPQFGHTLNGWFPLDSFYLNERLKEYEDFYLITKQDRQEYENEGRINEWPHSPRKISI